MFYMYRCLLSFALIVFFVRYGSGCNNFLVQSCVDIPFGFNSMSPIRCIQLIPVQFDVLIQYSVQNYFVKTNSKCYDIVSYNSSSTVLFSNECRDLCPEQYCLLFDNQPNTSVINIFYSESSTYELLNSTTNYMLSYDYLLFDSCSKRQNYVLLIVVYVLAGVVGVLTIAVILKYLISCILRTTLDDYAAYDWRWIRDLILCRMKLKSTSENRPGNEPNKLYIIEVGNETPASVNGLQSKNNFGSSTQQPMNGTSSSNNTHERRNPRGNNSGSLLFHSSSGQSLPTVHVSYDAVYDSEEEPDLQENNSSDRTENQHRRPVHAVLSRISSKASTALSTIQTSNGYDLMAAKSSREYPIVRL